MVAEEWVANLVEHGQPSTGGRITLVLRLTRGVVRVLITDPCQPFDPRGVAFEGPNLERGGGTGLALIASLCRIAGYERQAGRNRLILEFDVEAAG